MATTFWCQVNPLSGGDEPMDLGLDQTNTKRIQFGGNVLVTKYPSDTFEEEIVALLVDAGIDEDRIFRSSKALLPDDTDPSLTVIVTGGTPGLRVHNRAGTSYPKPSVLLVARAGSKAVSRALAQLALRTLVEVRNTAVAF